MTRFLERTDPVGFTERYIHPDTIGAPGYRTSFGTDGGGEVTIYQETRTSENAEISTAKIVPSQTVELLILIRDQALDNDDIEEANRAQAELDRLQTAQ